MHLYLLLPVGVPVCERCDSWVLAAFCLMIDAQFGNRVADAGACALGEGVKCSNSLQELYLVGAVVGLLLL
jgi:hypothetical protein